MTKKAIAILIAIILGLNVVSFAAGYFYGNPTKEEMVNKLIELKKENQKEDELLSKLFM